MRSSPTTVVMAVLTRAVLIGAVLTGAVAACGAPTPPPPPVPAATPPAATPPPIALSNELPADVLDLADWYLTLPTGTPGDPDTVHQPELATYSSAFFRLNDARDGVVFRADAGGVTTSGSKYPRSELREMRAGAAGRSGDEDDDAAKASWSNESGTHTLGVRQAVTAVPPMKPEVVTAQIHDREDDVMEIRVEGTRLIAAYADGDSEITIDPAYRLGTVFDLEIVAENRRVGIFYNGAKKADIDLHGSGWYFKSGSYVQSNPSRGDAPDAVGEVVIYDLRVTHSD